MMNGSRGLALGALLLFGLGHASAAGIEGRLSGAWATSPAECKKLFVRSGGGVVFRQPVDQFAQAAIIAPGAVTLPNQVCRVTRTVQKGGLTTLDFECQDSISYTSQSVEIEIKSGSQIVYRPNGDKTLDTALIKCGM